MNVLVKVSADNTKSILDLLEEQGISLPCNCHGANSCGGRQYAFPCDLIPKKDISVTVPHTNRLRGLTLSASADRSNLPESLLIDLGTTTIAMVYYNSISNTIFLSEVFENPQTAFGADVISRIKYDTEPGHAGDLQHCVQTKLLFHHTKNIGKNRDINIKSCFIGGNTTMIHLLMGLPLDGMKGAPFTPYLSACNNMNSFSLKYNDTDHNNVDVFVLPWLSPFVGGDIVAGILSLDFDSRRDTCLLADLGTNGELVLLHKQKLYTASTAAGPAFEGGGLSCGCPSIPGAISDVTLHRIIPALKTIDNKLAGGICGSGAISMVAELIHHGYIDKSGILTDRFAGSCITLANRPDGSSIVFSRNDLRQMQLAIASIGAGIDALCHCAHINIEDISHLYLAGGLGVHINLEKASKTGLFSGIKLERIHPVGNSCLNGLARIASNSTHTAEKILDLLARTTELQLADDNYYKKAFTDHLTYS